MSEVTVAKLAETVGTPVEKLLEQMKSAGLDLSGPNDVVSDEQKQTLLTYLKQSHGGSESNEPKRITLKRSKKSSLKVTGSTGKSKTVTVEVRKKRTYVKKPSDLTESESAEEIVEQTAEPIVAETKPVEAEKPADVTTDSASTDVAETDDAPSEVDAKEDVKEAEQALTPEQIAEQEKAAIAARMKAEAEAQARAEVEARITEQARKKAEAEAVAQAELAAEKAREEERKISS
ncbi:translation initiation factor IF-2 associated domain-containing protein [Pleionea litopenaei]|uniref:Translation initiation factor IF-2 associated domain-containing protein n=1 Tax=Pleionea litopenaei TaxID=3070815 RepID=A0AA51X657_9GAMM|nr:translation initiation factor IF-2 associated domain-containing protein [Pleionea sp. HL-JVS1]WMS86529.1 translation initiation factor IF-2 associated domain-containing protein [Pleionea sp. HL-JVS1]